MRVASLVLTFIGIITFSCNDKDDDGIVWGIGYSDPATINLANGDITQQNDGPLATYIVGEGFLAIREDDHHILRYRFTSGDSLSFTIEKKTSDHNYHYPEESGKNVLRYVLFNEDTLDLEASAISVQPRPDENVLQTVVNIHTVNEGDFNGTVARVPMVRLTDIQ